MKKLILGFLGLAFAFAISSCGEHQAKKKTPSLKSADKPLERHHDRW